jgi:class 3 adenylate cyclase
VDEMSRHPERFSMEGESREMSVLFSDVRGFTTISEGLDPKELSQLMNQFLTPLTQVIYRRRGTIDKYMGDCIMASGVPRCSTSSISATPCSPGWRCWRGWTHCSRSSARAAGPSCTSAWV